MDAINLIMAFLTDEGFVTGLTSNNRIIVKSRSTTERDTIFLHIIGQNTVRCGHEHGVKINLYDPDSFRKIVVVVMKCLNQTLVHHGYPSCGECDFLNMGKVIAKPKGLT